MPRPPARRKYETAIRPPDRNFFKLMASLDAYMWVVVKKNVRSDKQMYDKIYECYKSVKSIFFVISFYRPNRILATPYMLDLRIVHVLDPELPQSSSLILGPLHITVPKTQLLIKHLRVPHNLPFRCGYRQSRQTQPQD